MKVGDFISCDFKKHFLIIPGYDTGLIIDEKVPESGDPYEIRFRVLWDCGKISWPSADYLEEFEVIGAGG